MFFLVNLGLGKEYSWVSLIFVYLELIFKDLDFGRCVFWRFIIMYFVGREEGI